jgi:hypothetical protein
MNVDATSPVAVAEASVQNVPYQDQNRGARNTEFTGWEPTFVAGNMAPDLDVDAIIRSFMQEQGVSDASSMPIQEQPFSHNLTDPAYLPMGGMQRFEDMIFGFNAAEFDTLI